VLKKVSADFAKLEAQTKAQEESDQSLFDEDMKRCSIEKAGLVNESEMKGTEKKRLIEKQLRCRQCRNTSLMNMQQLCNT